MRQTLAIAGMLGARDAARADAPLERGARGEWIEVPAGPFAMGAREGAFAYDNERPRHVARGGRLPHRAPPRDQRELDALQRGRRLRAARVVVGRGLGVEGASRTSRTILRWRRAIRRHPPATCRWFEADAFARAHDARLPTRAGVGEGGDLEAGPRGRRAGGRWARLGVDGLALPRLPGLRAHTPTASTRRSSSASATACCAAARGRPHPRVASADVPQLGPARSAARSSPGVRLARDAVMERFTQPPELAEQVADRLAPRRRGGALARRRRARRPHAPVQGAAAEALLRRARRRAVRPHLRAARVLPDARRARDPRAQRRGDRAR